MTDRYTALLQVYAARDTLVLMLSALAIGLAWTWYGLTTTNLPVIASRRSQVLNVFWTIITSLCYGLCAVAILWR